MKHTLDLRRVIEDRFRGVNRAFRRQVCPFWLRIRGFQLTKKLRQTPISRSFPLCFLFCRCFGSVLKSKMVYGNPWGLRGRVSARVVKILAPRRSSKFLRPPTTDVNFFLNNNERYRYGLLNHRHLPINDGEPNLKVSVTT